MASPQESLGFLANHKVTAYEFDSDADPHAVAWIDMRGYREFTALVFHTVGTTKVDTIEIIADQNSDGSGTNIVVKKHASDGDAGFIDAVGDYAFISCTAEEIAQEAADAGQSNVRYVSVNLELGNAGDEAVIVYILSEPIFRYSGLSVDFQA